MQRKRIRLIDIMNSTYHDVAGVGGRAMEVIRELEQENDELRRLVEQPIEGVDAEDIWTTLYELREKPATYWEAVQLALRFKQERDQSRQTARRYFEWINNEEYPEDEFYCREVDTNPWLLEKE